MRINLDFGRVLQSPATLLEWLLIGLALWLVLRPVWQSRGRMAGQEGAVVAIACVAIVWVVK